jgi:hypothetical protein
MGPVGGGAAGSCWWVRWWRDEPPPQRPPVRAQPASFTYPAIGDHEVTIMVTLCREGVGLVVASAVVDAVAAVAAVAVVAAVVVGSVAGVLVVVR